MNAEPLPGLDLLVPARGAASAPARRDGDLVIVPLPRWDTDWHGKTGRGGWPKLRYDKRRNKYVPVKWRPVWDVLPANSRPHYMERAKATRTVIEAVMLAARAAGLPPRCDHLTVQLVWAPGKRLRADGANLMPVQKACVDALARGTDKLVGLRLVPDDTARWVTEYVPRIEFDTTPGIWLEVTCHG